MGEYRTDVKETVSLVQTWLAICVLSKRRAYTYIYLKWVYNLWVKVALSDAILLIFCVIVIHIHATPMIKLWLNTASSDCSTLMANKGDRHSCSLMVLNVLYRQCHDDRWETESVCLNRASWEVQKGVQTDMVKIKSRVNGLWSVFAMCNRKVGESAK